MGAQLSHTWPRMQEDPAPEVNDLWPPTWYLCNFTFEFVLCRWRLLDYSMLRGHGALAQKLSHLLLPSQDGFLAANPLPPGTLAPSSVPLSTFTPLTLPPYGWGGNWVTLVGRPMICHGLHLSCGGLGMGTRGWELSVHTPWHFGEGYGSHRLCLGTGAPRCIQETTQQGLTSHPLQSRYPTHPAQRLQSLGDHPSMG